MVLGVKIKSGLNRKKVIIALSSIILMVIIISSTIGKEIISGKQISLFSFAVINFSGYLFFLLLPVETLIPFYVSVGCNSWVLLVIALGTALVAQTIDYLIGLVMSEGIINDLVGRKKFDRYEEYIEKYGGLAIFVFNLLPLTSSVLSLVAGMFRFRIKTFWFYSFLGLLIKYSTLIFLFDWIF